MIWENLYNKLNKKIYWLLGVLGINSGNPFKITSLCWEKFILFIIYNKLVSNWLKRPVINLYLADTNELEFWEYLEVIYYISDEDNFCRQKNKNILKLFLYTFTFKKNILFYKNVLKSFLINIIILFNIILFNIKWIIIALIISILYFVISLFYIQIDFTKQVTIWYIFIVVYYLLMSTFNSFLIKYKYGKFTSAIQRFWKRTGIVFWLIESFLFLLFFYYFLNSSQEPLYMFDYANLNQELVLQLKVTYKNLIILSLALYLSFILIYNLNYLQFIQNILLLLLILLVIFYSLYIESYQFIYIISLFGDKNWTFEDISQSWLLEVEQTNIRVKQQYFIYCLIAKYWHFIFIFISWFFFFIKSLELKKISYSMLGYNTQNLLILYVLNIMCLLQWLKYSSKKFLEIVYYWFHVQYDEKLFNQFIVELLTTLSNLFTINLEINKQVNIFNIKSFFIFYSDNLDLWKFL